MLELHFKIFSYIFNRKLVKFNYHLMFLLDTFLISIFVCYPKNEQEISGYGVRLIKLSHKKQ